MLPPQRMDQPHQPRRYIEKSGERCRDSRKERKYYSLDGRAFRIIAVPAHLRPVRDESQYDRRRERDGKACAQTYRFATKQHRVHGEREQGHSGMQAPDLAEASRGDLVASPRMGGAEGSERNGSDALASSVSIL